MKKLFTSILAVSALIFAITSCSKEDDLTPGIGHDGKQVTYTVQIPGVEQSRAINPYNVNVGEGKLASKLVYAMYENGAHDKGVLATGFVNDADEKKNETPDGKFTVSLTLAKNINYDILFMAYNPDNCAFDLDNGIDLKALTIDKDNLKANQEQYDAFVGKLVKQNVNSVSNHVDLKRPFAQINAATTIADLEAVRGLQSEVTKSDMVIYQAPTTLNIFDNSVSNLETLTYAREAILTKYNENTYPQNEDIIVNNVTYKYLTMAYVLAGTESSTHDVDFTFYRSDNRDVSNLSVVGMPIQANFRTNIVGTLLTQQENYEITIDAKFGDTAYEGEPTQKSVATTAEELEALVNNATSDIIVTFANDLNGKILLKQKRGVDVTILGNKKQYTGGIQIFGNGDGAETLTIKDVNFDGTGLGEKEGCIYTNLHSSRNATNSYAHNVTIENCIFTGAGVAAIRQNNGGDRNWTIKNCTVDNTMHSFLQIANTENGLAIENCNVSSKNGANLNSTCNASFTNCEFNVRGYAVRVGVNSGGNPDATKLYTFTDCTFQSQNEDGDAVVIIRNDAQKATLNFENTELIGNPQISGYTTDTKINGVALPQQANQIFYVSDEMALVPTNSDAINATVVSNIWDKTTGKGIITFDVPLTTIGEKAFQRVTNTTPSNWATSITLPEGVETIGNYAFAQCYSLTNITIPNSVTSIGQYAFQSCDAVTSVTIGSGVSTIASGAFYNCCEIKEIVCKATTPPALADKWVFYGVDNTAKVVVPATSVDSYKAAQFWSEFTNIVAE